MDELPNGLAALIADARVAHDPSAAELRRLGAGLSAIIPGLAPVALLAQGMAHGATDAGLQGALQGASIKAAWLGSATAAKVMGVLMTVSVAGTAITVQQLSSDPVRPARAVSTAKLGNACFTGRRTTSATRARSGSGRRAHDHSGATATGGDPGEAARQLQGAARSGAGSETSRTRLGEQQRGARSYSKAPSARCAATTRCSPNATCARTRRSTGTASSHANVPASPWSPCASRVARPKPSPRRRASCRRMRALRSRRGLPEPVGKPRLR